MQSSTVLALILACCGSAGCAQSDQYGHYPENQAAAVDPLRQADVAARGVRVMPFDLDRSTHVFAGSADGGTQTVISKDGAPDQIALIRQHLKEEAAAFAKGDFRSPAAIHGTDMPGLQELSRAGDQLHAEYEEVDRGARIHFTSGNTAVVRALHAWFRAQVADHGNHTAHGSSH